MELSRAEVPQEAKLNLLVSPDNAVLIAKAVDEYLHKGEHETETSFDEFRNENPATKKLLDEIDDTLDIMLNHIGKEVDKVLQEK